VTTADPRSFCMPHWAIVRDNMPRGANGIVASILVMQEMVSDPRWPAMYVEQRDAIRTARTSDVSKPISAEAATPSTAEVANAVVNAIGPPCCWLPIAVLRELLHRAGVPEDALP
jgi:hypothetical protein